MVAIPCYMADSTTLTQQLLSLLGDANTRRARKWSQSQLQRGLNLAQYLDDEVTLGNVEVDGRLPDAEEFGRRVLTNPWISEEVYWEMMHIKGRGMIPEESLVQVSITFLHSSFGHRPQQFTLILVYHLISRLVLNHTQPKTSSPVSPLSFIHTLKLSTHAIPLTPIAAPQIVLTFLLN